ncbi:MAG TPA: hypothetical protein VMS65_08635 [Polyangiaceae bacterium]|nr:hypothetical protein [Polyangiaceae bacterium]
MRFGPGACSLATMFVALAAPGRLRAEEDPCSPSATVSPCFDADALWLPTGATHFSTLPSARPFATDASTLLFGAGLALEPVLLVVPSPDLAGRTVHVVNTTTTVTLGVGFGLGAGFGWHAELPFVPYQNGTGVEGVTAQQAPPLGSAAVRDPRIGIAWTALGRHALDPVALAAHFELVPPLGDETLLAGARGTTFAPGVTFEGEIDRFAFGADASLRLRSAVDFGSVTKGSEAVLGAGASFGLLASPRLRVGVEAWVRPGLAGAPPGSDALDLPAEWLFSSVFAWDSEGPFSLAAAGGSSLPVSNGPSPSGGTESFAGVTAPSFRALLALRFTPNESK